MSLSNAPLQPGTCASRGHIIHQNDVLALNPLGIDQPKAPRRFSTRWVAERCVCVSVDRTARALSPAACRSLDMRRDQFRLVVAAGDVVKNNGTATITSVSVIISLTGS